MWLSAVIALAAVAGFVYLVAATEGHGTAEFGLFILAAIAIETISDTPLFKITNKTKEPDVDEEDSRPF